MFYCFASIYYTEKVNASSNKVISLFPANYRQNGVAAEVIYKFIRLQTLIIQKSIHLIKSKMLLSYFEKNSIKSLKVDSNKYFFPISYSTNIYHIGKV